MPVTCSQPLSWALERLGLDPHPAFLSPGMCLATPCCLTPQPPLSCLAQSPGSLFSLYPHSIHTPSTQPELIIMAGACDMALTPQEPSEGPACRLSVESEPPCRPQLWGGLCLYQNHWLPYACDPRVLTPSCQHQRSYSGAKSWLLPALQEAKIPIRRDTSSVSKPRAPTLANVFITWIPANSEELGTSGCVTFQPSTRKKGVLLH